MRLPCISTLRSVMESMSTRSHRNDWRLTGDSGDKIAVRKKGRCRHVGQHLPLLHGYDALRIPAHEFHVMLDKYDGPDSRRRSSLQENIHERVFFRGANAACGFVEQDK